MLRPRCVGLATLDPALYAELAAALKERHIPSISIVPGDRVPERVAAVLTTPGEASRFRFPRVLTVNPGTDRPGLWATIREALEPHFGSRLELVVGIDPGPRPGYAILGSGHLLEEGTLHEPEEVAQLARQLKRHFPATPVSYRVGSGDHLPRDRILNALAALRASVQLVNEENTTPPGRRHGRDPLSARLIATGSGRAVEEETELRPTPGEVANLQRLSREESGGRLTIPRQLAARVLEGKMSFPDAIDQAAGRIPANVPRPREARVRQPS